MPQITLELPESVISSLALAEPAAPADMPNLLCEVRRCLLAARAVTGDTNVIQIDSALFKDPMQSEQWLSDPIQIDADHIASNMTFLEYVVGLDNVPAVSCPCCNPGNPSILTLRDLPRDYNESLQELVGAFRRQYLAFVDNKENELVIHKTILAENSLKAISLRATDAELMSLFCRQNTLGQDVWQIAAKQGLFDKLVTRLLQNPFRGIDFWMYAYSAIPESYQPQLLGHLLSAELISVILRLIQEKFMDVNATLELPGFCVSDPVMLEYESLDSCNVLAGALLKAEFGLAEQLIKLGANVDEIWDSPDERLEAIETAFRAQRRANNNSQMFNKPSSSVIDELQLNGCSRGAKLLNPTVVVNQATPADGKKLVIR